MVVTLVYVDDMLVTRSNLGLIEHTKAILHKAFKIKDLGELKFFLGMEFSRSAKGILMNQRKYALEIISNLGLGNAKPAWTPLEANIKLAIQELDCLTGESDNEQFKDKEQYQSKRSNKLNVYSDVDWAACPNTRRSVSGFLVKHSETLLSWKSKKQSVFSRSSAEAEYRSMANVVSDLVWIDALLKELRNEV
ncbi:uncharacterized mitochondrial protein AtMg00810-like [Solanum lycopersicum]|uniref:uncharacterized mitochondrial protein AtMg00810-like n=1 Tax=Solanum lycopersicum TaxID=4081 RepID=UPI0002BCA2BE